MESELLYPLQLLDVRLYAMSLERLTPAESATSDASEANQDAPAPSFTVNVDTVRHAEREQVSVFLTIEIKGPEAQHPEFDLHFTLEGLFEAQLALDAIEDSIWAEFESTSAITLMWPYAREYTHSFSRRMRADLPLLPTLNRLGMQKAAAAAISEEDGS